MIRPIIKDGNFSGWVSDILLILGILVGLLGIYLAKNYDKDIGNVILFISIIMLVISQFSSQAKIYNIKPFKNYGEWRKNRETYHEKKNSSDIDDNS